MCGIAGIIAQSYVNQHLYDALTVLQHRGQDAAGIVTCDGVRLNLRKDNGMVRDVFRTEHMLNLTGNMGIGHVRYPTAGSSSCAEAQPFYVNSPFGISLAHNGNLTNTETVAQNLFREDFRHINTGSDSEVLLNVFAHELQERASMHLTPQAIFDAMKGVFARVKGAYAALALITGRGIVGFRDPNGIRPLVIGQRTAENGKTEYMLASESVALSVCGFERLRDVQPGEAVYITVDGQLFAEQCVTGHKHTPCVFEYVYLARPDSIMDGISVYKARMRMGDRLADKIKREWPEHDIDVVIPIPDTSRTAAMQLAQGLGVKYREGFIKNRYIGRTFIMPGQTERKKSVRQKLNAIELEFKGKNVLLVDDSIVRGTTCEQIIQMARDAGAQNVYFASAAPPVRYQNVYGIDMPALKELIAHDRTEQEVADLIGADRLIFQDLDDLINATFKGSRTEVREFDCSVFNGEYVTGDITPEYLLNIEGARNDGAKSKVIAGAADPTPIDLHNHI
ncbi:MAG: amidophosphoribosyltransferase [Pseudomonadota bacterium]|nr:amidophosphoribosyltransferase [Gammaproteobacteria bacterium]MEC8011313.1 amidophosphoribosyltransferase [Pseudomonadota bacterium]|tara:strand:- start:15140 stop:16663 length:1524 start_codon:yes stop_codon:yes gene_type:complete